MQHFHQRTLHTALSPGSFVSQQVPCLVGMQDRTDKLNCHLTDQQAHRRTDGRKSCLAFCLGVTFAACVFHPHPCFAQVQQALLHANMPAEIRYEDEWEGSNCCQLAAKSTLNSTYSPPPAVSAKSAPASWRPPSFCVKQSSTSEDPPLALADAAAALAFGVGASGAAGKAERVKSAFTAAAVQASIQEEEGASPQRDRAAAGEAPGKGRGLLRLLSTFSSTSSCNGAAANPPALTKQGSGTAAGLAQRLRSLCGGGSNISDACGISSLPTPTALSADASSASGTGCSRVSGRVTNSSAGLVGQWWKQLLFQGGSSVGQQLFKGLRVRIGIASGSIRRGQDIETTLAYSKARGRRGLGSGFRYTQQEVGGRAKNSEV